MANNRTRVEYIWLDGRDPLPKVRSKTRFIDKSGPIPEWNFDGGSTEQGSLDNSDRSLRCVRTYNDPFNKDGYLAFCEVDYYTGKPHETNTRSALRSEVGDNEDGFWVGFEQEFTLINSNDGQPLGLLLNPQEQGQYYCGVGTMNVIGRSFMDRFEECCTNAGLELDGINAEVMPGQWEFQTRALDPLHASDDLWVARYLLERVAEEKALIVTYDPKPHPEFNGAGCHTNISTAGMRNEVADKEWALLMLILEGDHSKHMEVCGEGYERRMTGDCETSNPSKFTWGIGDRGASVRIPERVLKDGCGYMEDRRPCANIDPYKVLCSLIFSMKKVK